MRLLQLTFKRLSFKGLTSGMAPERLLFWRFNPVSCVRFQIASGMWPVKELNDRSSTASWGENEAGISPEKLLC